jgi:NADH-quinone oxidoreductase subunit C
MMTPIDRDTLQKWINERFGGACTVYAGISGDLTFNIPAGRLSEFVEALMADLNVVHLSAITAQQRAEKADEIELLYHFWQGIGFSLMTSVPTEDPQIASLINLIPGADFYEREVAEMFGVVFTGREETPHLLLSEQWDQAPPFRENKGGSQ